MTTSDQSEGVADEVYRIKYQRKYRRDILKSQQGPRRRKKSD